MSQSSATNERQIKLAQKQAKADALVDKLVIGQLMSTEKGRRWVYLQLEFAHIWDGNENLDPGVMAFEKGRRNTGLKLLASVMAHAAPQYVKMLEESSGARLSEEEEDTND